MTRPLLPCVVAALLALVGCAPGPDFAAGDAALAPFPTIQPIGDLLGQIPPDQGDYGTADLAARAASLRARADALRGTDVIDPATEAQMDDALAQR